MNDALKNKIYEFLDVYLGSGLIYHVSEIPIYDPHTFTPFYPVRTITDQGDLILYFHNNEIKVCPTLLNVVFGFFKLYDNSLITDIVIDWTCKKNGLQKNKLQHELYKRSLFESS